MESNLVWYSEGQTHLSTPWHARMSLILNGPIQNVPCKNLHTKSKHALKPHQTQVYMQNNQVLTKSSMGLNNSSIAQSPTTKYYRGPWWMADLPFMQLTRHFEVYLCSVQSLPVAIDLSNSNFGLEDRYCIPTLCKKTLQ